MAAYDLENRNSSQLSKLVEGPRRAIILGATLVCAAMRMERLDMVSTLAGRQAAVLYDTLQKAARANDLKTARETAGRDPRELSAQRLRAARGAGFGQIHFQAET